MSRIVIADRRFKQIGHNRGETKLLVDVKGGLRRTEIPDWMRKTYENNPESKKLFGFVSFRGLKPSQAQEIVEVARAGKIILAPNRMGDITSWKLKR